MCKWNYSFDISEVQPDLVMKCNVTKPDTNLHCKDVSNKSISLLSVCWESYYLIYPVLNFVIIKNTAQKLCKLGGGKKRF